jgi:hypothetical protein
MAQEDDTVDRRSYVTPVPTAQQPPQPPDAALWSEITALLAISAGIADVEQLRTALARGLHYVSLYEAGAGLVRTADGQYGPARAGTLAAGERIGKLIEQLDQALVEAGWPLGGTPQATELRTALDRYAGWMTSLEFAVQGGRGPPKSSATALALSLAHAWPRLTGKRPTAWRAGGSKIRKPGEPGGDFYEFFKLTCKTFGLEPPSPDTIRRALTT